MRESGSGDGPAEGTPPGFLFDPIRRRNVPDTPEERVRQAVLRYLLDTLGVPPRLIGVEFSLAALQPGNFRRMDIVAWRPGKGQLAPWLLVECKAPGVRIDDAVAMQAAGYLAKVPCAHVMLTNGADSRYLERAGEGYRLAASLPFYPKG
jgi:hypothetical protein